MPGTWRCPMGTLSMARGCLRDQTLFLVPIPIPIGSNGVRVPSGWPVTTLAARSGVMGPVPLWVALRHPTSTGSLPGSSAPLPPSSRALPSSVRCQGRPRRWGAGRERQRLNEIPRERRHECLLAAGHCRTGCGGAMCRTGSGRATLQVWVVRWYHRDESVAPGMQLAPRWCLCGVSLPSHQLLPWVLCSGVAAWGAGGGSTGAWPGGHGGAGTAAPSPAMPAACLLPGCLHGE